MVVDPSSQHDLTVVATNTVVSRQVDAVIIRLGERVTNESSGGGLDIVEVSTGQETTVHADLSRDANLGHLHGIGQYQQLGVADSSTDGNVLCIPRRIHHVVRHGLRGLGGPIEIDDSGAGCVLLDLPYQATTKVIAT